jgi:hypothetical protein
MINKLDDPEDWVSTVRFSGDYYGSSNVAIESTNSQSSSPVKLSLFSVVELFRIVFHIHRVTLDHRVGLADQILAGSYLH